MFSYYGSKYRLAPFYPKPQFDTIKEPFCGAAQYSLRHYEKNVILSDLNPKIVSAWQFLIDAKAADIKNLPFLKNGDDLRNFQFLSEGERSLLGFMGAQAIASPVNIVSPWGGESFGRNIKNVLLNIDKVSHWEVNLMNYTTCNNEECTWFVDPPYQVGGHKYPCSSKKIDYKNLGEWCMSRMGQTIVCENGGADWLPFVPFRKSIGVKKNTLEVFWTNRPTSITRSLTLDFTAPSSPSE